MQITEHDLRQANLAIDSTMLDEAGWKHKWLRPGSTPYCSSDEKVIATPPFGHLDIKQNRLVRGYNIHEVGHAKNTPSEREMKADKNIPSGLVQELYTDKALHLIANVIEDMRIEAIEANEFAGAGPALYDTACVVAEETRAIIGDPKLQQPGPIAEALYWLGLEDRGVSPGWNMTPKAKEFYNLIKDKFISWKTLPNVFEKKKGYAPMLKLSKEILEMLKDKKQKDKEQEQQKKEQEKEKKEDKKDQKQDQQKGQKGDKSQKPQKGEKGEKGEPGEPGDGEPGDDQDGSPNSTDIDKELDGDKGKKDKKDKSSGKKSDKNKNKGNEDEKDDGEDEPGKGEQGDGEAGEDSEGEDEDGEGDEGEGDDESSDSGDEGSDEDGKDKGKGKSKDDGIDKDDDNQGEESDPTKTPSKQNKSKELSKEQKEAIRQQAIKELQAELGGAQTLSNILEKEIAKVSQLSLKDDDDHYASDKSRDTYEVAEDNERGFQEARSQISCKIQQMATFMEQIFASIARVKHQRNLDRGKIDKKKMHLLAKSVTKNIFYKTKSGKELNTCVSMIVDESGSMSGAHYEMRKMLIAFSEVLNKLGIPFEVMGFSTHNNISLDLPQGLTRTNPMRVKFYKTWKENYHIVKNRLGSISHYNNNIDGEDMEIAAFRMSIRKEKRKILLVFSDGCPEAGHYNSSVMCRNITRVATRLRKTGIEVYAFGLDTRAPEQYYGKEHFIYMEKNEGMSRKFFQEVYKIMSKGFVKTDVSAMQ